MSAASASIWQPVWRHRTAIAVPVLACLTAVAWWQIGEGTARGRSDHRDRRLTEAVDVRARELAVLIEHGAAGTPELVEALTSNDPRVRREAVSGLTRKGEEARPYVPAMRLLLRDPDAMVRGHSAMVLAHYDPESAQTAEGIGQLLLENDPYVRGNASLALCELGAAAVPVILPMMKNTDPDVRLQAVQILQRLRGFSPDATAALRRAKSDRDAQVRDSAVVALLLDQELELTEVIHWIHSANPYVADTAITNLPRFGKEAVAALPDLVAQLESPLPAQLLKLMFVLQSMKGDASRAVPALVRLLDSPVDYDIAGILETLVEIGADRKIVVPLLVRFVDDESVRVASRAGSLLSRVDPATARQQARLLGERLNGQDLSKVERLFAALRGLGVNAVESLPRLVALLQDENLDLRDQAAQVISRIGPGAAQAVPVLAEILQQTPPGSRAAVSLIEAAGAIGPEATVILPTLMGFLDEAGSGANEFDRRPQTAERIRSAALTTVASLGECDTAFLEQAHAALSSESMGLRVAGLQALAIVGHPTPARFELILLSLNQADSNVRLTVAQTVVDSAGESPRVIALLIDLLHDRDLEVRAAAAASLGRVGPAAVEAVPQLRALHSIRDNYLPFATYRSQRVRLPFVFRLSNLLAYPSVVQAADYALGRIDPEGAVAKR